jgi:dihydropteroate synthase
MLPRARHSPMIWKTHNRQFDLSQKGLTMGVLNVTSDSFSDGGQFLDPASALAHARSLLEAGADVLDIGGESTRPGASPVDEAEEIRRVLPVIEALARETRVALSIDTMKPGVARAALEKGAEIVNDVTGLQNAEMRELIRSTGCGAVAMHMKGTPRDMQDAPFYGDILEEIRGFFRQTLEACLRSGIDPLCLAFDPGIGFGKTLAHNLTLLRNLESLRVGARPLVLGVSRKSFIAKVLGTSPLEDRHWPTVALTAYGRIRGAQIVRVHEVAPNLQAMRMTEALLAP